MKRSVKNFNEKMRPRLDNVQGTLRHNNGQAIDLDIAFAEMFGYQKEELLGKNLIKILIPSKYHGVISENIKRDYKLPYTIEGIKKDGTAIPIRIEGRTVLTKNKIVMRVSTFHLAEYNI